MKKKFKLAVLCGVVLTMAIPAKSQTLVWSDEFSGTALNTSKWTYDVGTGPNNDGWGNQELEYYRSGTNNAVLCGGYLNIIARKETYGSGVYQRNYTSARIKTQGKFSRTYGDIRVRMQCPIQQGLWPCFWMLGNSISSAGWPACGEIDVAESRSKESNVYATAHWSDNNNNYARYGTTKSTTLNSFHEYKVNWNSYNIKWFIDGVQFHIMSIENGVNGTSEFHSPFFLLLNLAIGGGFPGSPDATTVFPSTFKIDYVRVYKQNTTKSAVIANDVEAPETNLSVNLYPNPVTDGNITIQLAQNAVKQTKLSIIDMSGKLVFSGNYDTNEIQLNFAGRLNAGMYNVLIANGTNTTAKKLIVK
jgi:beta-glucanase (GH16 family)